MKWDKVRETIHVRNQDNGKYGHGVVDDGTSTGTVPLLELAREQTRQGLAYQPTYLPTYLPTLQQVPRPWWLKLGVLMG